MILASDLIIDLIKLGEKAANIARFLRHDESMFQLLIEEKKDVHKNKKFSHDFKTLADVLIQAIVIKKLNEKYPKISKILGEEQNEFTNKNGEKIRIELKNTEQETADLLMKIFNENSKIAKSLSKVSFEEAKIKAKEKKLIKDRLKDISFNSNDIGIWIDPIDATNEYVSCNQKTTEKHTQTFRTSGLFCVCCLIGIYSRQSGKSIGGIVNFPFHQKSKYSFRRWSVHIDSLVSSTGSNGLWAKSIDTSKPIVVLSENEDLKQYLSNRFHVIIAKGAGFKLQMVCEGLADVWICSSGSTFKWDTCAGHVMLKTNISDNVTRSSIQTRSKKKQQKTIHSNSQGNLIECNTFIQKNECKEINYLKSASNSEGVIAFRETHILDILRECLAMKSMNS